MSMHAGDVKEILERLALQDAAEGMQQGLNHGSKICKLPVKSWQADIVRKATDMPHALNPMDLRRVMHDPAMPVIFVPHDAVVTQQVIERICVESPLDKTIIWETD